MYILKTDGNLSNFNDALRFFFIDKCYVDAFPSIKCNEFSNLNTSFKIPFLFVYQYTHIYIYKINVDIKFSANDAFLE
jgi:hypothetical protein